MNNIEFLYKKYQFTHEKSFFMLVLLLWAGMATPLVKFYSPEFPYIFFLNIMFLSYYFIKYKNNDIKRLLILLAIFILWYILICFKYNGIQKTDFTLVYCAVISFVTYGVFPKLRDFFLYFEKVLIFLSVLSLIVWGSVTLVPSLEKIFDSFAIYKTQGLVNSSYILVGYGHQMVGNLHRNLGFAWEAGRFASLLVIGIFINLHNHNLKISWKNNRPFWILLFSLITTFSTTGIAALGGVFLFYVYNKSSYSKVLLILLAVLSLPTLIALPFIGDKITENLDYQQEMSNMMYMFTVDGTTSITPQRITGFYLEFLNLSNDPILGYNINDNSYMMKHIFTGFDVWLSDGFLQILAKYGILLGSIFYIFLFRTSAYISRNYKFKGKYSFALVFVLISFSYDFWGTGLFFYLVFYTYFIQNKGYANKGFNNRSSI